MGTCHTGWGPDKTGMHLLDIGGGQRWGAKPGWPWSDLDELREHWQVDHRFEPQMSDEERARRYRLWKKAVTKSLDWVDDDARTLMDTLGD